MRVKNRSSKKPSKKKSSKPIGTSAKRADKAKEVAGFRKESLKKTSESKRTSYFASLYKPQGGK